MHEFSLVQGLMDRLQELATEQQAHRVLKVTMEIGPFSGVVIDSFCFGFEALAPLRPLTRDAELIILNPPLRWNCGQCDHVQEVEEQQRPEDCPCCGNHDLSPLGANDVVLRQVEME